MRLLLCVFSTCVSITTDCLPIYAQVYIWCSGEVVEVADGKTTKKSPRCKSPLPWGAVRIKWPEDKDRDEPESFVWSVLKPADWNEDVHLGWRYDAAQLAKEPK